MKILYCFSINFSKIFCGMIFFVFLCRRKSEHFDPSLKDDCLTLHEHLIKMMRLRAGHWATKLRRRISRLASFVCAFLSPTMVILRTNRMYDGKILSLCFIVERMCRHHLHDLSWRVDEWHLCKPKWPEIRLRQLVSKVLCQPPKPIPTSPRKCL